MEGVMDVGVYACRAVAEALEAISYEAEWRVHMAEPPTEDQIAYVRALAAYEGATDEAARRKALAWIDAITDIMDPEDCDQAIYNVACHLGCAGRAGWA